ncbi:MAG TPA: DUF4232 domain-containing protein [Patescibacteria group bacterium]|nr:DUF4232 domain-containing protein [Patescibacteria group bacterium]
MRYLTILAFIFIIAFFVLFLFAFIHKSQIQTTPTVTLAPIQVTATTTPKPTTQSFCNLEALQANITTEGAAGSIYGTLTIKNISKSDCDIQGNQFIIAQTPAQNVTTKQQLPAGSAIITLKQNQTVYSQIHYPNGPQCNGPIKQSPVTFSYNISPSMAVMFKNQSGSTQQMMNTCNISSDITQIDVWSISDTQVNQ